MDYLSAPLISKTTRSRLFTSNIRAVISRLIPTISKNVLTARKAGPDTSRQPPSPLVAARRTTKHEAGSCDCAKSSPLRFLRPGSVRSDGGGQGVPKDMTNCYLLGAGELLPLPGPDGLPVVLGAFAGLPAPPPLPPPDFPPPPPLPLSTGADTLNLVSSFRLVCGRFPRIADGRATKRATSTGLLVVVRSGTI